MPTGDVARSSKASASTVEPASATDSAPSPPRKPVVDALSTYMVELGVQMPLIKGGDGFVNVENLGEATLTELKQQIFDAIDGNSVIKIPEEVKNENIMVFLEFKDDNREESDSHEAEDLPLLLVPISALR